MLKMVWVNLALTLDDYMKLNALTSLRFFAAFGVLLEHLFQSFPIGSDPKLGAIKSISSEGFIWVGFFFILSGFIISYSFDSKGSDDKKNISGYLFNRFSRIYPLHFIMLVIFILFISNNINGIELFTTLANLLLIQSWIPDASSFWGFNAVSWSISNEAFFYISFILLIKLNLKYILSTFAMLLTIIISSRYLMDADSVYSVWLFYINPAFRVLDFICGMLIYRLYKYIRKTLTVSVFIGTIAELTSILVMVLFIYAGVTEKVSYVWRCDIFYIIPMSLVIIVFSLEYGLISKFISNKFLVLLGEASFSLYMIHTTIFALFYLYIFKYFYAANVSLYVTIASLIFTCVVMSLIVFSCYERPVNNSLKNWLNKKTIKNRNKIITYDD